MDSSRPKRDGGRRDGAPRPGAKRSGPPREGGAKRSGPPREGGAKRSGPPREGGAKRSGPPREGGAKRSGPPREGGARRDDRSARPDRSRSTQPQDDRPRGPRLDPDITAEDLDKGILLELRTLPEGLAELVAKHLVAAQRAMDADDLKAARAHIAFAHSRASRVAAVREAAAVAAYRDGDYAAALAELRTLRRMSGGVAFAPMMADCERGLGRPRKALDVLKSIDMQRLDPETKVELLIVAAGARADMAQLDAAIVTLKVPELTRLAPGTPRARLQYAYADLLLAAGRVNEAWEWMERAAGSDVEGATDAVERCDEFAGITLAQESADPASD